MKTDFKFMTMMRIFALLLLVLPQAACAQGLGLGTGLTNGGGGGDPFPGLEDGIIDDGGAVIVDENGDPIIVDELPELAGAPLNLEVTAQANAAAVLFFAPPDNGWPVTDYVIEWKLSSDTLWTVLNDGVSTETAATITGLSAGVPIDVRAAAINEAGQGPYTDSVSVTPTGAQAQRLDQVLTGVVACWDARQYSGGAWQSQTTSPADGALQSAYALSPSGGAMHNGTDAFIFDGTNTLSLAANTPFIQSLGQTNNGNDFSFIARVKTRATPNPQLTILGTAGVSGDHGVVWRVDTSGANKIDQFNGIGLVTRQASAAMAVDTFYTLVVSRDQDQNRIGYAANADVFDYKTAGWSADTSAPTNTFRIGSEGNGDGRTSGWALQALCLVDHDLTQEELVTANDWMETAFPAAAPVAPGKVYSVVAMPSDGKVHLAWDVLAADLTHDKTGGSPITDYVVRVKPAGGAWGVFSDGVSASTFTTVTGLSNSQSYEFDVMAVNAVGSGATSDAVTAAPQARGIAPYNIGDWKVTLPVNSAGNRQGSAQEITPPAILTYESAWFNQVGDYYRFNCVYPAAATATAKYGRCEGRGLTDGKQFNHNQDARDVKEWRVAECPTSAGDTKVVVHQIHNADAPQVKINYDCRAAAGTDRVRALMKIRDTDAVDCDFNGDGVGDTCPTIKAGMTRGTWTNTALIWDGDGSEHDGVQTLEIYADGVKVVSQAFNITAANNPLYFKAGNYCQLGPAGSKTSVEHRAPQIFNFAQ